MNSSSAICKRTNGEVWLVEKRGGWMGLYDQLSMKPCLMVLKPPVLCCYDLQIVIFYTQLFLPNIIILIICSCPVVNQLYQSISEIFRIQSIKPWSRNEATPSFRMFGFIRGLARELISKYFGVNPLLLSWNLCRPVLNYLPIGSHLYRHVSRFIILATPYRLQAEKLLRPWNR